MSAQNRPRLYWTNINFEPIQDKNINLIDLLDKEVEFDYVYHEGLKVDKTISENSMNLISNIDNEIRIKQSTKKGYIIANSGDGVNLSFPLSKSRRGRVIGKKSSTLDTSCDLCVYYDDVIRRFTLEEMEKLQTLPTGYTEGVADRARVKAIGNGWTVDVISHILGGELWI
jgi:DNA (cytosine-5)-methyltransferase 3A